MSLRHPWIWESLPIDVTALGTMVAVILLEPWTGVGPADGVSGFASPATITVLAMFILSEGIRRTGVLRRPGNRIVEWARGSFYKQYGALIGLSGSTAGLINNTPVVAMMIPMAINVARKTKVSPSKLLMPISFASMMGGMLTLIGTSTSILASDVSARLIGHPFSMFEFTALGAIVLGVGFVYLMVVGHRLIPERIEPEKDLIEVVLLSDNPLIGETLRSITFAQRYDALVLALRRHGELLYDEIDAVPLRGGDTLLIQASAPAIEQFERNRTFVVVQPEEELSFRSEKLPTALGIIGLVVGLAALEVMPSLVSTLDGLVAMVATGCVRPPRFTKRSTGAGPFRPSGCSSCSTCSRVSLHMWSATAPALSS